MGHLLALLPMISKVNVYLYLLPFQGFPTTVNLGYNDQDHAHKSMAIMDVIAVIR